MPTLRPPAEPRSDSPSSKRTRAASARTLLTSDDLDLVRQGAQLVAALDDAELYERLLAGVRWDGTRWAPNKFFAGPRRVSATRQHALGMLVAEAPPTQCRPAALRASATAMDLSGTDAEKLIDVRCVRGFERLKQLALRGAGAVAGCEALASLDALRSLHLDKVDDVREVLSSLPAGLRSLEVDLTTATRLSLAHPRLDALAVRGNDELTTLRLGALPHLTTLAVWLSRSLVLVAVEEAPRLRELTLQDCHKKLAVEVPPLPSLRTLRTRSLSQGTLRRVLKAAPGLTTLELSDSTLADFGPVLALRALERLTLWHTPKLLDLTPLQDLPRLSRIVIPRLYAPGTLRPSVPQGFRPRVVRRQ